MKILITENKIDSLIKKQGISKTIKMFGGFENYCKLLKINGPMEFLKSLPVMDVVESEERPFLTLFRYKKGDNIMVYDRTTKIIFISPDIWGILENDFGLIYSVIPKIFKKWLDEVYNLRGVTCDITIANLFFGWMRFTI